MANNIPADGHRDIHFHEAAEDEISFEEIEDGISFEEEIQEYNEVDAAANVVVEIEKALDEAGIVTVTGFESHLEKEGEGDDATRKLGSYTVEGDVLEYYKGKLFWKFTGLDANGEKVEALIAKETITRQPLPPVSYPQVAPLREYRAMTMLEQYADTIGKKIASAHNPADKNHAQSLKELQTLRINDVLRIRLKRHPLIFLPLWAGAYESYNPAIFYDGWEGAEVSMYKEKKIYGTRYEKRKTIDNVNFESEWYKTDAVAGKRMRVNPKEMSPDERKKLIDGLDIRKRRRVVLTGGTTEELNNLEALSPDEVVNGLIEMNSKLPKLHHVTQKEFVLRLSKKMWHHFNTGAKVFANTQQIEELKESFNTLSKQYDKAETAEQRQNIKGELRSVVDRLDRIGIQLEKADDAAKQIAHFAGQISAFYQSNKALKFLQPPALLIPVLGLNQMDQSPWRRPEFAEQLGKSYRTMANDAKKIVGSELLMLVRETQRNIFPQDAIYA